MTLREVRFYRGLGQVGLAQRANVSQSRISLIERGKAKPSAAEKARIASAVGLAEGAIAWPGEEEVTPAGFLPNATWA